MNELTNLQNNQSENTKISNVTNLFQLDKKSTIKLQGAKIDSNKLKKMLTEKIKSQVDNEKMNPLHLNFGLKYILNAIDIYGREVNFRVGKNKKTVTNVFGGFMTIVFFVMVLTFGLAEIVQMYTLQSQKFIVSDYTFPIKEKYENGGSISLGDYKDSFNMIIGTTNSTINWFDNQYI